MRTKLRIRSAASSLALVVMLTSVSRMPAVENRVANTGAANARTKSTAADVSTRAAAPTALPAPIPEPTGSPGYRVNVVSGLEKVFPSTAYAVKPKTTAKLALARNEYEGIQVVVEAPWRTVRVQGVTVSDLKSDRGGVIPAGDVKWYRVDYIRTTIKPPYPIDHVGYYPDPLLPPGPFQVKENWRVPVWVEVHTPKDIPAGLYRGTVIVRVEGRPSVAVPLGVTVYDFTLPDETHLHTLTWIGKGGVQSYYRRQHAGPVDWEAYQDILLEHRLGPGGQLPGPRKTKNGWDFSRSDAVLQRLIGKGMNAFLMGTAPNLAREKKNEYTPQFIQSFSARMKAYGDHLRQKGWIDKAYVYTYDEAPRRHWGQVKKIANAIHRSAPGLRVLQCLNQPAGVKALAGYVDVFDVYVAQYHQTGVQAMQQEKGTQAWLAVCCYPMAHPNLFTEYPLIDARILPLFCWKYHAQGFEYWSPVAWRNNTEIFKSSNQVHSWNPNTFGRYNGDGDLLYPGADGLPYPSLRLKGLRDGFEDYEYLWMLNRLVKQAKTAGRTGPAVSRAEGLLRLHGLIADSGKWNHTVENYFAFRAKVAAAIVRLTSLGAPRPAEVPAPTH